MIGSGCNGRRLSGTVRFGGGMWKGFVVQGGFVTVGKGDGCYMVVTCMVKMVVISFLGLILCEKGF